MLPRRLLLMAPLVWAQEPEPIRVSVNLVNVPFSVTDEAGRLVSNLEQGDFEVLEDGVPQAVKFFSRAENSKLTLALLVDTSGSQSDFVKDHRRDMKDFLKTVLKPGDQAMTLAFGANVWEVAPPGTAIDESLDRLKDLQKSKNLSQFRRLSPKEHRDGASSVHDGVYEAARALEGLEGRRAIVVFSDGEDTSSAHHVMEAIEAAQEHAATVFALRYTELRKDKVWTARNKYGRAVLERLARETGGLDFDAAEEDNLRLAFEKIAAILRSSYDLAYSSSSTERDGSFRKIRIRAKRAGLMVRHKTGYYARPN